MIPKNNKRRSKRLRKKLHIGDFKEFGFRFETELRQTLSADNHEALVDAFLCELIEPRRLALGGWVTGGFIASDGRGSSSEEDREAVRAWLTRRQELASVEIGPLVDAWSLAER